MAPRSVRVCKGKKKKKKEKRGGSCGSAPNMLEINSSLFPQRAHWDAVYCLSSALRAEPCPTSASSRQLLGAQLPTGVGQKGALLTAGGGGGDTGGEEDD